MAVKPIGLAQLSRFWTDIKAYLVTNNSYMSRIQTDVAAGTANKGTYTGGFPVNSVGLLDIIFTAGNTAASPTIVLGGVTYSLINTPTVAKSSGATGQRYRFSVDRSMSRLYYIGKGSSIVGGNDDYIVESGESNGWAYKKFSDGTFEAFTTAAISSGTLTMTQISTSQMWASNTLTLTLPSIGIVEVRHANLEQLTTSYTTSIARNNAVGATVTYQVNKNGSSTSAVSFTGRIYGTWM